MQILNICVNYNSYKELENYLSSLESALENYTDKVSLDVYIVDNSSIKENIKTENYCNFSVKIKKENNKGYLGGALSVLNNINNLCVYDFIIISNVDLLVDKTFFYNLQTAIISEDVAWIAPQIYSNIEKRDKNPRLLHRYSKFKLLMLLLMYKFPILHKIYNMSLYKAKKLVNRKEGFIYAGHGSFMIFTNKFFKKYDRLEFPVFLYCEELFFAELIRLANLKVYYDPKIKILDIEHVSTSKMKSSFYYKCNIEAVRFIINKFYNQNKSI